MGEGANKPDAAAGLCDAFITRWAACVQRQIFKRVVRANFFQSPQLAANIGPVDQYPQRP